MLRSYRESHLERGGLYDEALAEDPFSSYMDYHEEILLKDFIARTFGKIPHYLDFACGTARITRRVEPLAEKSWGVDVSPTMLEKARARLTKTTLIEADLTKDKIDLPPIDLITSFRFFGNAENELRHEVLRALNGLLRPGGWIVINNHRNPNAINRVLNRLTGGRDEMDLTVPKMKALFAQHGFAIREITPIGVWAVRSAFLNKTTLNSKWAAVLEKYSRLSALSPFAPDMLVAAQKTRPD